MGQIQCQWTKFDEILMKEGEVRVVGREGYSRVAKATLAAPGIPPGRSFPTVQKRSL